MEGWNPNIKLILSRAFQSGRNIGVLVLSVFYSCVVTIVPIAIFDFFDEGRQHLGRTIMTMLNSFRPGEDNILSPAFFVEFYVGSIKEILASQFGGETIVFLFFFVLVPLSILIFPVLTSKLGMNKQRWPFIVLNLMFAFLSSYYVYLYIMIGLSPSFL